MISGFFICNFHMQHGFCNMFVMGMPEILHSSQLQTTSKRPRQRVETHWWRMVAFGRWQKKCHFLGALMCFSDMWKLIFVKNMARGIHREISQHRRYSQIHHRCFAAGQWHHGNSRNIAHCYRIKKIYAFYLEGFLWHFDDFRCNVWAKCYEMAWSTSVFFLLHFGTHGDWRSGWEHHRTMMFGHEVTQRPAGDHILKTA